MLTAGLYRLFTTGGEFRRHYEYNFAGAVFHTERNPSFISAPQQRQRLLARGALLESQVINDRIDIRTSSQANNATTPGRGMSFAPGMIG